MSCIPILVPRSPDAELSLPSPQSAAPLSLEMAGLSLETGHRWMMDLLSTYYHSKYFRVAPLVPLEVSSWSFSPCYKLAQMIEDIRCVLDKFRI